MGIFNGKDKWKITKTDNSYILWRNEKQVCSYNCDRMPYITKEKFIKHGCPKEVIDDFWKTQDVEEPKALEFVKIKAHDGKLFEIEKILWQNILKKIGISDLVTKAEFDKMVKEQTAVNGKIVHDYDELKDSIEKIKKSYAKAVIENGNVIGEQLDHDNRIEQLEKMHLAFNEHHIHKLIESMNKHAKVVTKTKPSIFKTETVEPVGNPEQLETEYNRLKRLIYAGGGAYGKENYVYYDVNGLHRINIKTKYVGGYSVSDKKWFSCGSGGLIGKDGVIGGFLHFMRIRQGYEMPSADNIEELRAKAEVDDFELEGNVYWICDNNDRESVLYKANKETNEMYMCGKDKNDWEDCCDFNSDALIPAIKAIYDKYADKAEKQSEPQVTSEQISACKWRITRDGKNCRLVLKPDLSDWTTEFSCSDMNYCEYEKYYKPEAERIFKEQKENNETMEILLDSDDKKRADEKERKVLVERLEKYRKVCSIIATHEIVFDDSVCIENKLKEIETLESHCFFSHLVELLYDTRNQQKVAKYVCDKITDIKDSLSFGMLTSQGYEQNDWVKKDIITFAEYLSIPELEVIADMILTITKGETDEN